MADTFTADQLEEWKDYWELFDMEGKGNIKWGQIGSAIRSFGWAPTNRQWQQLLTPGEDELGNHKMPTKQELENKEVTFDEFIVIMAEVSTMPSTGTVEDFMEGMKVFDKESNGYVLAVEIQHVLGSLGEPLSHEEIDSIFKDVKEDISASGQMKYDLFVKHFMADPADG